MNSILTTPNEESHELIARFTIEGEPVSKSRARFTKRGSKTFAYTPQKTLDGERAVAKAFKASEHTLANDPEVAYAVHMRFHNGTRQRRDVDNMVKLVLDGLNKLAWVDDVQVLEIAARKLWVNKDEARTDVEIYQIGKMSPPKSPCIYCGKEFRTYDSWKKNPNGKKYCSTDCAYAHRVERRVRNCEECGVEFHAWGEQRETRFCSMDCNSANKRVTMDCDHCGQPFTKQRCLVRTKNYCSDECIGEAQVQRRQERKSTRFPGTCLVCGAGTTRKEYKRCNPCKKQGAPGKPKSA